MWRFNNCPRCGGDIYIEKDKTGWYENCLQCGYTHEKQTMPVINKSYENSDSTQYLSAVEDVTSSVK